MVTARRFLRCMVGLVAAASVIVPADAHASSPSDDAATSTIVASEGPVKSPEAGAPEVGPILVPADSSSFSGAWWLVAFGGVQLAGLLVITRRARARLSTEDAQP